MIHRHSIYPAPANLMSPARQYPFFSFKFLMNIIIGKKLMEAKRRQDKKVHSARCIHTRIPELNESYVSSFFERKPRNILRVALFEKKPH